MADIGARLPKIDVPPSAKLGRDHPEDMLFLNVAGLDRSAGVLEIGVPKLKIDAAGRITLSPEVLTHLGVGPGSELDVEMTGNASLTFRRPRKAHSIAEAFGSLQSSTGRQLSIDEINEAIAKGW